MVEDLKNGHSVTNMYGKGGSLIMDSPHIIVFSNQDCPRKMLTIDRWKIFEINSKTLKLERLKPFNDEKIE